MHWLERNVGAADAFAGGDLACELVGIDADAADDGLQRADARVRPAGRRPSAVRFRRRSMLRDARGLRGQHAEGRMLGNMAAASAAWRPAAVTNSAPARRADGVDRGSSPWSGLAVRGCGAAACGITLSCEAAAGRRRSVAGAVGVARRCCRWRAGVACGRGTSLSPLDGADRMGAAGSASVASTCCLAVEEAWRSVFCLVCSSSAADLNWSSARDQRAVQFVIGKLQIGDAVLIGRLHLLIAVILGRDDAVLEDHVDGGERDPAEEDQRQAGQRRLQRGAEGEELHPAVAADVDLALGKRRMKPRPDALDERHRPCRNFPFGRLSRQPQMVAFHPFAGARSSS